MQTDSVKRIIRNRRQYRVADSLNGEGISKIWNNGMGRIGFIAATPEGNVVINALFWRKTDARVAVSFMRELEKENAQRGIRFARPSVICVEYGYPYYYNHAFGRHNPCANEDLRMKIEAEISAEYERVASAERQRAA